MISFNNVNKKGYDSKPSLAKPIYDGVLTGFEWHHVCGHVADAGVGVADADLHRYQSHRPPRLQAAWTVNQECVNLTKIKIISGNLYNKGLGNGNIGL